MRKEAQGRPAAGCPEPTSWKLLLMLAGTSNPTSKKKVALERQTPGYRISGEHSQITSSQNVTSKHWHLSFQNTLRTPKTDPKLLGPSSQAPEQQMIPSIPGCQMQPRCSQPPRCAWPVKPTSKGLGTGCGPGREADGWTADREGFGQHGRKQ